MKPTWVSFASPNPLCYRYFKIDNHKKLKASLFMNQHKQLSRHKSFGFTIVELLIVIVVIGILAAITIVAFNGVQQQARETTVKAELRQAATKVGLFAAENSDAYPTAPQLEAAGVDLDGDGTTFEYSVDNNADPRTYCITGTQEDVQFYISSTEPAPTSGVCPGHSGLAGPSVPEPVGIALASGNSHSCQLYAERAYCWGYGPSSQLGIGSSTASVPTAVSTADVLSGRDVTAVSGTCALADGQVFCWGPGIWGQLGNGASSTSTVPVAVSTAGVLSGKTVTAVSSGGSQSCALADGDAFCWGYAGYTGDGTDTTRTAPAAVSVSGVLAGRTVTSISSGSSHVCAVADGQAFCWGAGALGQLGNDSTSNSNIPVAVSTSGVLAGRTVTAISAGYNNTCAIADGEAFCWGLGTLGMLANGAAANSDIPVAVSTSGVLAGRTVTAIRNGIVNSGSHPNCAIADGEAFCWGLGTSGQLGNNASLSSNTPVAVDMSGVLSGLTVTDIAPGSTHTCALADNNVYCWGSDSNGRLGNGPAGSSTVPVATIAPSS